MGLFCCFTGDTGPPTQQQDAELHAPVKPSPPAITQQPDSTNLDPAAASDSELHKVPTPQRQEHKEPSSWSKLNETESAAVKQTLLKVRDGGSPWGD